MLLETKGRAYVKTLREEGVGVQKLSEIHRLWDEARELGKGLVSFQALLGRA